MEMHEIIIIIIFNKYKMFKVSAKSYEKTKFIQ